MFVPICRFLFRIERTRLNVQHTIKKHFKTVVVETDDGSSFVLWHPERKFPYEFTRPLPPVVAKEISSSHLKMDNEDSYQVFKQKSQEKIREELMKITSTTKHRWFPRARDRYRKKLPQDRPYL